MKQTVFLVEHGWQAQRQCSLLLDEKGVDNICVIKGRLTKDVLANITAHEHIKIVSLCRKVYRFSLICFLLRLGFTGGLGTIVVDNKKTQKMLKPVLSVFKAGSFIVRDEHGDFSMYDGDKPLEKDKFINMVKQP